MHTLSQLRDIGRKTLKAADIKSYTIDTDVLLMFILSIDKNALLTRQDMAVSKTDADIFCNMLERRCKKTPIQYIIGKCEFMSLEFLLDENVLIPRPDTEILVETVLAAEKAPNTRGLEIGIGSGCISVSIEYYGKNINMTGVDISPAAVKIAKKNSTIVNIANSTCHSNSTCRSNSARYPCPICHPCSTCHSGLDPESISTDYDKFFVSDLYKNVPRGTFCFIVSNPPYIKTDEIDALEHNVKGYEPITALDGGIDGLDFYRKITNRAAEYLSDSGRIYFEIGHDQAVDVSEILKAAGFVDINVKKDLAGKDRVVFGRLS